MIGATVLVERQQEITEDEKVAAWRFHVLLDAGYSTEDAEALANSHADLHKAEQLVANGCPPETAARILI